MIRNPMIGVGASERGVPLELEGYDLCEILFGCYRQRQLAPQRRTCGQFQDQIVGQRCNDFPDLARFGVGKIERA